MNEVYFPLAAVATTFFVVIPLLTLLCRGALAWSRRRTSSWANFGSETTFGWLVAPTLLPILWLTSSALHQSEPGIAADPCLMDHVATTCVDTFMLLGFMLAGIVLTVGVRLWREWPQTPLHRLGDAHELSQSIGLIARNDAYLRSLRIAVVEHSTEPIFTLGLLRPIVVMDACFVRDADASMLRAALLHEYAHITGLDTLRSFMIRLCLSVNPAGSLLQADFARWRSAREALCDTEAVHHGGEPLALAESIVKAARFRCGALLPNAAALCGDNAIALRLRVTLLLDGPPAPVKTLGHIILLLTALAIFGVPHLEGFGLLEHFHFEVERVLHLHQ
ncbi:M56 family metallopeptidase [Lujinxingia vulgaris]|uniref:M56 family metallopeptidase n=1 Tax=Lujinxingia vulgaris TaxID=2600176 RepID=A0A5C6X890_9DELT|nr:M56 family metallopeptidase [Lujinxingia vulgaris]TXD35343.1 M56 family metallopeptidase [Lujinxingia vulgaris]